VFVNGSRSGQQKFMHWYFFAQFKITFKCSGLKQWHTDKIIEWPCNKLKRNTTITTTQSIVFLNKLTWFLSELMDYWSYIYRDMKFKIWNELEIFRNFPAITINIWNWKQIEKKNSWRTGNRTITFDIWTKQIRSEFRTFSPSPQHSRWPLTNIESRATTNKRYFIRHSFTTFFCWIPTATKLSL